MDKCWEVRRCTLEGTELDDALRDGWEPFSVTVEERYVEVTHEKGAHISYYKQEQVTMYHLRKFW